MAAYKLPRVVVRRHQGSKETTKGQAEFVYCRLPVGVAFTPNGVAEPCHMRPSVMEEEFERRVAEGSMERIKTARLDVQSYDELRRLKTAPLEEGKEKWYLKIK